MAVRKAFGLSPSGKPVARDSGGLWSKGHSGNPTGKNAGRPLIAAEVKKLARSYGADAIEKLRELMETGVDERTQKAAADSLLDRGYGRPVQQIEAAGPGAFEEMEEDELRAYIRSRAHLINGGEE